MRTYTEPKLSELLPSSFTKDIEDLTFPYRQRVSEETCQFASLAAKRLLRQIEKVEKGIFERYERKGISLEDKCHVLKYALKRLIEECENYSSLEEYDNYISAEFCRSKIYELQKDLIHVDNEFE